MRRSRRVVFGVFALVCSTGCFGGGGGDDDDDDDFVTMCEPVVDDCSGENICINGDCVAAFGRTYRFSIPDAQIATQNPDGEAWDALGGAPDPYVVLTLNSQQILQTSEPQDTFTPTFPETADAVIPAGARLVVEVFDGDVTVDDVIIACEADPLTASFLRGGGVACENTAGTSITVLIDRR